jgi:prolycopene isomerase
MSPAQLADGHDAIVIGSGLAGLTAGALLATRGLSVLVVEQASEPGGYAHAFRRGPYTFDPAVHIIPEARDGQVVDVIFRHLGVRDRLQFVETGSMYEARLPDKTVRFPTDLEGFIESHVAHFPRFERDIREFLRLCAQLHAEAHDLPPAIGLAELDAAAERYPVLFRHQGDTAGEMIESHFDDPLLVSLLGTSWPYSGLVPSRLSFLTFAQYLSVTSQGMYFCLGGFQSMVDALVSALEGAGGELLLDSRVTKIAVQNGRVSGVELAGGRTFSSDTVIACGSARSMLLELVGEEHLPSGFVRRLRHMEPSLSDFVAYGVLGKEEGDPEFAHDTFVFRHADHDENYRDLMSGRPSALMVNIPTIVDPTLAPEGEHIINLTVPIAYDIGEPWAEAKQRVQDEALALLEERMPELRGRVRILDSATPVTLERYTGNEAGAMLGWSFTPQQTASRRLTSNPPVAGLLLAGHWTQPGSGALRVLVSGFLAGQRVLEQHDIEPPRIPLAIDSAWRRRFVDVASA